MGWLAALRDSIRRRSGSGETSANPDHAPAYTDVVFRNGKRRRMIADGRQFILPRLTFEADGLATAHSSEFLSDPRFRAAYSAGVQSGHRIGAPEDLHIEWRVYVCCWAASYAARVPGDFVECGVSTGTVSLAVCHYVAFAGLAKSFWLFDTFAGIPEQQAAAEELPFVQSKNSRLYFDCYDLAKRNFAPFPNVRLVKGLVPESLDAAAIERIAYLHIDMNIAYPEVEASRRLWDRLSEGAIVIYDDYGSVGHRLQKQALDAFASERGVEILSLPTGQGLLIKSPGKLSI